MDLRSVSIKLPVYHLKDTSSLPNISLFRFSTFGNYKKPNLAKILWYYISISDSEDRIHYGKWLLRQKLIIKLNLIEKIKQSLLFLEEQLSKIYPKKYITDLTKEKILLDLFLKPDIIFDKHSELKSNMYKKMIKIFGPS